MQDNVKREQAAIEALHRNFTAHRPKRPFSIFEDDKLSKLGPWLEQRRKQLGVTHYELEKATRNNHTTIDKILKGEIVPSALILMRLTTPLKMSLVEAYIRGGYVEILLELIALHKTAGEKICKKRGVSFSSSEGVIGDLKSLPIAEFQPSYDWITEDDRKIKLVVPTATAIALHAAVLGFPRRGDVLKPESSAVASEVLQTNPETLDEVLEMIERRGASPQLPYRLEDALRILSDSRYSTDARFACASELVQEWADSVCQPYAWALRVRHYESQGKVQRGSAWLEAATSAA